MPRLCDRDRGFVIMNILILDDEAYRHQKFDEFYGWANLTHVYSANDAYLQLHFDKKFDVVFLDHDLGDNVDQGIAVSTYICEHLQPIFPVVVHSMNVPAARNMVSDLISHKFEAVHIPFGTKPWEDLAKSLKCQLP